MQNTILQEQQSCSVQKTVGKNTKYWRNETILKNRASCKGNRPCKGYSLFKMVSLGQKLKMLKTCKKNHSTKTAHLFCAKKRLEKAPNIGEMGQF